MEAAGDYLCTGLECAFGLEGLRHNKMVIAQRFEVWTGPCGPDDGAWKMGPLTSIETQSSPCFLLKDVLLVLTNPRYISRSLQGYWGGRLKATCHQYKG
jgi:hypothetical protein